MSGRRRAGRVACLVLFSSAACDSSAPHPPPRIASASVQSNAQNAISAMVAIEARDADSVRVLFRIAAAAATADSATAAEVARDVNTLAVLGLLPETPYVMRPVAYGRGGVTTGAPIPFITGALPADLPRYVASGDDPSPGYVVFAAARYGLVIDNTGRVVWYRHFPDGLWLNFMPQRNDRYVARRVTPDKFDRESWVEVDALGAVTRTFGCAMDLQPRFHDLIVDPDGGYWTLCDDVRLVDLSGHGGHADAEVTGTAVQHIGSDGALLFHWTPFDHFNVADVDSATRAEARVNWTHGNAIDIDADGNLLVSFRNLNEITSIDTRSGAVRWRLGGARSQFTFGGDSGFAGQHGVRALPADRIVLLDNIGAEASRAEEWRVDRSTGTAMLIGSRSAVPAVRTLTGGSVQPLSQGRTLVSFGTEGRVEEYDASGRVVWRMEGTPGYVFRAQRIPSLYHPGVGRR